MRKGSAPFLTFESKDRMEFQIFHVKRLDELLRQLVSSLEQRIDSELPEYLMSVNEDDYVQHLVSSFSLEPPAIHFDKVEASAQEKLVPARDYFTSAAGQKYKKQVVTFHIPFTGDPVLLQCAPSTRLVWSMPVRLENGCFCFDCVDYEGDGSGVKREYNAAKSNIEQQLSHLLKELTSFNQGLEAKAREHVLRRKKDIAVKSQALASLGVPIRKSKNVPAAFTVPPVRKKVMAKPASVPSPTAQIPILDEAIYQEILQTVFDMGTTFEKYPSTYAGKDEMTLRDHLILLLEPRFEGSTTGETFNKTGKTDILIKYQKGNIFVAECKFWGGKAKHHETIDQLLSYLTWRDSKTAIVYFVDRKEITPVLEEIEKSTPSHPCYLRTLPKQNPSWHMFEFHLPSDRGCKIFMAILAFHIPK